MHKHITREALERVARIYKSNTEASAALGIAPDTFGRLCRKYDIETPSARKRRQKQEAGG